MKKKIITIISIAIFSSFLWGSIYLSGEYSVNFRAKIKIVNLSSEFAVTSFTKQDISLSLKGEGWQLAQFSFGSEDDFLIQTKNILGSQKLSPRDFLDLNSWIPSSVQIVEISPEFIEFSLEKSSTKKIKINPNIIIEKKPGYDLVSRIFLFPDSVQVAGPESVMKNIEALQTVRKKYEFLEDKVSENIFIEKINELEYDVSQVKIEFDIQKIVDKTFENVKVFTVDVPSVYQLILTPGVIRVVLRGGINLLGKLTNDDINLYVTYQQALSDTLGTLEPIIEIPGFTTLIDLKPRKLGYIIKKY